MAKYSKYHSNYILSKKHQTTNKGVIWERDWVTIGEINVFEKGKKPIYNDGNFLFTDNSVAPSSKRHNFGKWVAKGWTYDDVQNALPTTNRIELNIQSEDIRDFAYYGSATELIRSSIENIIKTFPAQITTSVNQYKGGYIISNPFAIDLYRQNIELDKYDNPMRYMSLSWDKYTINGNDINNYSAVFTDTDGCYEEGQHIVTVTIDSQELKGYWIEQNVLFTTTNPNLVIKPKDEVIEEYFRNLRGFEKQLLNRETKPLYTNNFITPVITDKGEKYVKRQYTWPSDGYCITIDNTSFTDYVLNLSKTASIFDESMTDNLYRSMTHEAIKNFDWEYERKIDEDLAEENLLGGLRMESVLRIIARCFDDVKMYIDGIKKSINATYEGFGNLPVAEITDKLDDKGWSVTSVIPVIGDIGYGDTLLGTPPNGWYAGQTPESISCQDMEVEFMRRLLLSSNRIFASKGTCHSIAMMMAMFGLGNDIYSLQEFYWKTQGKSYDDNIGTIEGLNQRKKNNVYIDEDNPFDGLMLKDIMLNGDHVIVPYYTQDKRYNGDVYFQSKGGWGKYDNDSGRDMTMEPDNKYSYSETISYLSIVHSVADLFTINPNEVENGSIYYVANLSDYSLFKELNAGDKISHFFYVINEYEISLPQGWGNVPMDSNTEIIVNGTDVVKYAKYLDGIISTTFGNNPHVGYGRYDDGSEFIEYMEQPFKYMIDNDYFTEEDMVIAENVKYELSEERVVTTQPMGDSKIINNATAQKEDTSWFINDKYIIFENLVDNNTYKEYFRENILPYIMQVIPSTTILILKNFN